MIATRTVGTLSAYVNDSINRHTNLHKKGMMLHSTESTSKNLLCTFAIFIFESDDHFIELKLVQLCDS